MRIEGFALMLVCVVGCGGTAPEGTDTAVFQPEAAPDSGVAIVEPEEKPDAGPEAAPRTPEPSASPEASAPTSAPDAGEAAEASASDPEASTPVEDAGPPVVRCITKTQGTVSCADTMGNQATVSAISYDLKAGQTAASPASYGALCESGYQSTVPCITGTACLVQKVTLLFEGTCE